MKNKKEIDTKEPNLLKKKKTSYSKKKIVKKPRYQLFHESESYPNYWSTLLIGAAIFLLIPKKNLIHLVTLGLESLLPNKLYKKDHIQ